MASPTASNWTTSSTTTAGTSHTINVLTPSAGDLLVVFIRFAAAPGTVTFTGYTLATSADTSDASDDETRIYYRLAAGTEGGTDPLTTSNSVKMAALTVLVRGHSTARAPVVSTAATYTTSANTANSGSVAPAEGSRDYLFLAFAGQDGEVGSFTAAPTNYTLMVAANSGTGGAPASNCYLCGAYRELTAASDDPGAWTHGAATSGGTAYTVAIHPSGAFAWTGAVVSPFSFDRVVAGGVVTTSRSLLLPNRSLVLTRRY